MGYKIPVEMFVAIILATMLFVDHLFVLSELDYKYSISKSIMFLEAQRSKKPSSSKRIKWRGDSALTDGKIQNVI